MGKTGVSCFSIVSCGRDREEEDESGRPEAKPSLDRQRWSFKRRLSRRQIPDDCVVSEPVPIADGEKEIPKADYDCSSLPPTSHVPERLTVAKCLQETPPVSPPIADTDASESIFTSKDNRKPDCTISDADAIVIQTAVRVYLAVRDLEKRKSVIKLQAAVRGHLARRQAVSTLRCVQAIIKMQSLVRARRMRLNAENLTKSGTDQKVEQDEMFNSNETESFDADPKRYSSTEISLRNGFARLLLKSKPKTKPIYISCDPSKSDSSWKWLERWMAAGHTKILEEEEESNVSATCQNEGSNLDTLGSLNMPSESLNSTSCSSSSKLESSNSEEQIEAFAEDSGLVASKASLDISSGAVIHGGELKSQVIPKISNVFVFPSETLNEEVSHLIEKRLAEDVPHTSLGKITTAPDLMLEPVTNVINRIETSASGTLPRDYGKSVQGLETSSPDVPSSFTETSMSHDSVAQGDFISEPGTDVLSILAIGLHDKSKQEIEQDEPTYTDSGAKSSEKIGDHDIADHIENAIKFEGCIPTSQICQENKLPEASDGNREIKISPVVEQSREPLDETTGSVSLSEQQAYRTSPDTSPRSHTNAAESTGTPSSQLSTTGKSNKKEGTLPHRKPKLKLASKKSPVSESNESNRKKSLDLSPDGSKSGKGDNSSMTGDCDKTEQENRTSVSKSLPSYMQTTESARAKFHSSSSPRASSDDNDKDTHMKKRLSLPAGSGLQDSPSNIQRSASQVQQSSKGNATHSTQKPAERKWVR